jgi:hypothetical protein
VKIFCPRTTAGLKLTPKEIEQAKNPTRGAHFLPIVAKPKRADLRRQQLRHEKNVNGWQS